MAVLSVDILKAAGRRVGSPIAVPTEAGLDRQVGDVCAREILIRGSVPATANPIKAKQV